jgi:hypothetical protein
MPMDPALKKLFIYEITLEPYSGQDGYAKPSYGTAKTYKARIERTRTMIRAADGHEEVSERRIFLDTTDTTITTKDRITLPTAFTPTKPKIIDVQVVSDHKGVHHVVLFT